MKDYYDKLGISPNATQEEIKERFRFLAHAYHPDKFPTANQKRFAEEEFKKINEAFQVLSDSEKRVRYDRTRISRSTHDEAKTYQRQREKEDTERQHAEEAVRRKQREQAEAERRQAEELRRKQQEQVETERRCAEEEIRKRHQKQEADEKRRIEDEQRKRQQAEYLRQKQAKERKMQYIIIAVCCISCILFLFITQIWPTIAGPVSSVPATVGTSQSEYVLYAGPNVNNPVIGRISANTRITLIGRSGDTWVAFLYGGDTCWIQEIFLDIDGNHLRLPEIR